MKGIFYVSGSETLVEIKGGQESDNYKVSGCCLRAYARTSWQSFMACYSIIAPTALYNITLSVQVTETVMQFKKCDDCVFGNNNYPDILLNVYRSLLAIYNLTYKVFKLFPLVHVQKVLHATNLRFYLPNQPSA